MLSRQHGFTLEELFITLAIASLTLAMALPAFGTLIADTRLNDTANLLIGTLHQARAEAIRRNQPVYVCALDANAALDLQGCASQWREGALLYADQPDGRAGRYDGGEMLRHALFHSGIDIRAPAAQLAFDAQGRLDSGHSFVLRERNGACRSVRVEASGKARSCQPRESDCDAC